MLSQTCIINVESLRFVNQYATFMVVSKFNLGVEYDIWCRALAPSVELLKSYETGRIKWTKFTELFKTEMYYRQTELRGIAWKAVNEDVYLVSKGKRNPDYRFILLDMIEELAKTEGIPVEICR